jgi:hypothetical protein
LVVVRRCACLVREVPFLLRELPDDLLRDGLDEPLRLVDLFELERLRVDRLLEDFVVWAIFLPSSFASMPAAPFAPTVPIRYPSRRGLNLPFRVSRTQD